jgi:hypothetical protein
VPFRHVVMFQWADDAPEDQVDQVRAGLDALPPLIPQIRSYLHGPDVGVSEGNFDYVVVADFDNVNDWRTYRDHPLHILFIEECIKGKVKQRGAVQYQTPSPRDPFDYSEARMQEFLAEPDEFG